MGKTAEIFKFMRRGFERPLSEFGIDSDSCHLSTQSEHLAKLRELTGKLQGVPASEIITPSTFDAHSYTMQTEKGDQNEVRIYPIYFDGLLRVERAFIPKGHRLKAHYHEGEVQHISVVKGTATIKMCPPGTSPTIYTVKQGRSIYIESHTPHNFEAVTDCYIVNLFMACHENGDKGLLSTEPTIVETTFDDEKGK